MHTYQREPDEECATSWTEWLWGSSETGEIFYLPSGQYKSSHRLPSSKIRQQDKHVKEVATETTEWECILPPSCIRHSFFQSPWDRPRREATHPRCCPMTSRGDGVDNSPVIMAWWTPECDIIQSRCFTFNRVTILRS